MSSIPLMRKIKSILKLKELGLPTPKTLIITDIEKQYNEINNFLAPRSYVMIRTDKGDGTFCPRILKCPAYSAKDYIRQLLNSGYAVIMQDYVPLNNRYSGNALVLSKKIIIEAIEGGPVSKISREGLVHQHIQINKDGEILYEKGRSVIPMNELSKIVNLIKNLPAYHIYEFSAGPDWFYFWQAKEEPTSKKLDF